MGVVTGHLDLHCLPLPMMHLRKIPLNYAKLLASVEFQFNFTNLAWREIFSFLQL